MASGATPAAVKIGIIGGTGLDDPEILEGRTEKYVDTPFGKPSDALILGKIKNVDCVLLARHGRQHSIMPSKVNYQANIWALKEEGCTHVIVTTACGSLREEIQPGDIVIIDQFIDSEIQMLQRAAVGIKCGIACNVCGSKRKQRMTQESEKGTKLLVAQAQAARMLKADPGFGEWRKSLKT